MPGHPHSISECLCLSPGSASYSGSLIMYIHSVNQMMAPVLGYLPHMWRAQIEFLTPGLSLALPFLGIYRINQCIKDLSLCQIKQTNKQQFFWEVKSG